MDETPFTIRIKTKNYEVELTGSRPDVIQTLDELPIMIGKITDAFNSSQAFSPPPPKESKKDLEDALPTISVHAGISCPDAIIAVLSTDWGRKQPRNMREILETMKVNALHFPVGTVKGRLTDLTKKGRLRRIRGPKGYNYVVA
jgi:hypothetical protein